MAGVFYEFDILNLLVQIFLPNPNESEEKTVHREVAKSTKKEFSRKAAENAKGRKAFIF